jgi:Colicin E5 ribonuclease domain
LTGVASVDSEAPRRLITAVKRLEAACEASSRRAGDAMRRELEDTRRELSAREMQEREARRELAARRAQLDACIGARRGDCAHLVQAVREAERAVARAARRMELAREAAAVVRAEQDRFEGARRRFAAGLRHHAGAGIREIGSVVVSLDKYLAGHGIVSPSLSPGSAMAAAERGAASAAPPAAGAKSPFTAKISRQMTQRGWTEDAIHEAVASGKQFDAINKAAGRPATRYVHPVSGRSVVVDDVTGEVIHVGEPSYRYGRGSGDVL